LGAAQVGLGRSLEGMAILRGGLDLYQGLRSPPVFWPLLLSVQAAACLQAGAPVEGLAAVDSALEIMGSGDGTTLLPELQILKGDLLSAILAEQDPENAEAAGWYGMALDNAQKRNARMSQLRTATRLCRIAVQNQRLESARRVLAEIYGRFTEGWSTRDLIEAHEALGAAAPES
jgi:hypothetical protein